MESNENGIYIKVKTSAYSVDRLLGFVGKLDSIKPWAEH